MAANVVWPILSNGQLDEWTGKLHELNTQSTVMAKRVVGRLPGFLHIRCPDDKKPGRHWLWDSFIHQVKRIATMAVLANQHARGLEYTGARDSYLNSDMGVFPAVLDDEHARLDGCYLAEDTNKKKIIRAGATERGFRNRWSGHARASRLSDPTNKYRDLYQMYPHKQCAESAPNKRGTFDVLQQRVGLGVGKTDRSTFVNMFQWTDWEEAHLCKLKYDDNQGSTLEFKKYKHLCYLFELFFNVAIEPKDNITQNPTCEWQLRLYSDKTKSP
jgi:hypothetical protein